MPRIEAPTIAEHVARQEQSILDAAAALFAERGFADTSMADIAAAVGLARSSVYRYHPDKEHILLAWFERETPKVAAAAAEAAGPADDPPGERLARWLAFQVRFTVDPDHAVAARLRTEVAAVSTPVQAAIAAGHARLWQQMHALVAEVVGTGDGDREVDLVVSIVEGMLRAATEWALDHRDEPQAADRAVDELTASVGRLLTPRAGATVPRAASDAR